MRTAATPREVQELLDQLKSVPADRRVPIIRMTFRIVGLCAGCDEPIRACDPRVLVDGRLAHRTCTGLKPERELYGAELQEAKDREVRKVQAMREEAAAREGR